MFLGLFPRLTCIGRTRAACRFPARHRLEEIFRCGIGINMSIALKGLLSSTGCPQGSRIQSLGPCTRGLIFHQLSHHSRLLRGTEWSQYCPRYASRFVGLDTEDYIVLLQTLAFQLGSDISILPLFTALSLFSITHKRSRNGKVQLFSVSIPFITLCCFIFNHSWWCYYELSI